MKNTAKTYCYEKVASPDAALYYSLRKLIDLQRDQIVAIHAFYREMEDIIFECQDHELAITKLNWWRGEVAKLGLNKSDHPVMILLQQDLVNVEKNIEKIQARLLKIIDGFEQASFKAPFETFEEVVVHWMRTAGERELLLNEILGHQEIISDEMIYQLMLVVEIVNYIQHLRLYIRHDVIYFSTDELQKFAVTQAMLSEFVTTEQIKNLLAHQTEKVERGYLVLNDLSKKQRAALSHLVIRCKMARAVLQEIQGSEFRVLENLIKLTPLRYGWIALRSGV